MKKLLSLVILALLSSFAEGQNIAANSIDFASKTVGTLPAASSNKGRTFQITDGVSNADCTVGGGTSLVFCRSNGTSYFPVPASTLPNINQVSVSGVTTTYAASTFGQALVNALTGQSGLHTFDGSGFSGTQTWNTSGYLGVGGTGHIILPCAAINLSVSITQALRTGLYGCNPSGTNLNAQGSFPTQPTGGTVSTQNAASGSCAGNCVIGSGTNFVSGMSSIVIAGTPYSVVSVQSTTLLTVSTQPGSSSGQSYTADQPMITWGPGSTFSAPLSNFQANCQGNADIGINNAGSQENSTTTNVRVQDCPVANFQLSNTDGSINSHVQNVYMANLNSLYINAVCTSATRAFYLNTNGGGVYIDKLTAVLGNSNPGTGCQHATGDPLAVAEVNGPIEAHDWHVEANRLGDSNLRVPALIAVGLTNAGNSHNDTFVGTKFATANLGAGFKIYSGVTSFLALNTDGVGSQLTDLIYDVGNSNHITLANNPKLLSYELDNNGNAWMRGGNCSDMTNGFCMGQGTTVWEYIVSNTVVASLDTSGNGIFNSVTINGESGSVGKATCVATGNIIGHCTSVVGATGGCTCVTP
jgi:hypothetical protein